MVKRSLDLGFADLHVIHPVFTLRLPALLSLALRGGVALAFGFSTISIVMMDH